MGGIPWGNGGGMADVGAGTHRDERSGTSITVGERAGARVDGGRMVGGGTGTREDDSKVMMEGIGVEGSGMEEIVEIETNKAGIKDGAGVKGF